MSYLLLFGCALLVLSLIAAAWVSGVVRGWSLPIGEATGFLLLALSCVGMLIGVVLIVVALLFGSTANAHDFYSIACCSGRDCTLATPGDVTWTPAGYLVLSTGETIPANDTRIQFSPPGEPGYRLCVPPYDGKVRCLYVPESDG